MALTLFRRGIFAAWEIDYALAFAFGIAFQYFTIKPMKKLSAMEAPRRPGGRCPVADGIAARRVRLDGARRVWIFGHELPKTTPT